MLNGSYDIKLMEVGSMIDLKKRMFYKDLDLAALTDDEAIFFIRIRGKNSYFDAVYTRAFLDLFSSVNEYRCISEYKKDADIHIDLNNIERDYLYAEDLQPFIESIEILEVVSRCRALRHIPFVRAKKLIVRAYLFFERFYSSHPLLKLVVCGAIDNYVMDIMQRVGQRYNVCFLGVTDSFMSPTYKLISLRGEANDFTRVDESEVSEVFTTLKGRFVSPIIPSRTKALKSAMYDVGSYCYRYIVRYLVKHRLLGRLEYEYQFAPLLSRVNSLRDILGIRFLQKSLPMLCKENGTRYAYIPMHYYPEATTDYWIADLYHVDYYVSLYDTIRQLKSMGFEVVVKEHPAFYLARAPEIYRKILEFGSILISPFVATKDILNTVDLVVVWNGSTGIEALIEGVPIVKITNSYYGDGIISGLASTKALERPTTKEGMAVVEKVLASSFRTS